MDVQKLTFVLNCLKFVNLAFPAYFWCLINLHSSFLPLKKKSLLQCHLVVTDCNCECPLFGISVCIFTATGYFFLFFYFSQVKVSHHFQNGNFAYPQCFLPSSRLVITTDNQSICNSFCQTEFPEENNVFSYFCDWLDWLFLACSCF